MAVKIIDDRIYSSHQEDVCFSLQRTNPRLSGNIKVVVWNEDNAFVESISASDYLSNQDFKALPISFGMSHPKNISLLANKAADLKYWYDIEFSSFLGTRTYDSQYSQKYEWGAYSEVNPLTPGQYRFFAPFWIGSKIPDRFLIFRTTNNEFTDLASYFKSGTLIKSVDLTNNSKIGKYLRDYVAGKDFKRWCSRFSYSDKSSYYGIDLNRGVLSPYYEDRAAYYLANERALTESNSEITNAWQRGNIICHKLMNMEFAFDDLDAPTGFNNYVGVYVLNEEITPDLAQEIDQNGLLLGREHLTLNVNDIDTKIYDSSAVLPPYYVNVASNMIVDSKQEYAPVLMLDLVANPDRNSKIILKYNGATEVEIKILESDLFQNLDNTRVAISKRINEYSFNAQNISIRSYIYKDIPNSKDYIVIQMQQNSSVLEAVEAIIPRGLKALQPITKTPNNGPIKFTGVSTSDVLVKGYINIDNIDRVVIGNNQYYTPVHYFEYLGNKVLRLLNFNPITRIQNETIKLQQLKTSKILKSEIVKHRDFDFSTEDYYYNNIFDWDLSQFKSYLTDIASADNFVGAWTPSAPITLIEYRKTILDAIDSYFANIKQPDEILIKDLDPITLEAAVTVKNEYDRFGENAIVDFINKNRLESFVSKWASSDGTNSYAMPYGLNTNLAFRSDNFAPSHKSNQRDVNFHTHSWFIIGEGANPYSEKMHIQLSYSRTQITIDGLKSTTTDEYNKLKVPITYDNDKTYYHKTAWSEFYLKEGTVDTYKTFFRGLDLEVDGDFADHKFAAILLTRSVTDLESESDIMEIIVNRKFKTVTLVIKFHIPDPILTSLERGSDFYYLDRSLLYYVTAVLQSRLVVEVFGTARISLNLYDTELVKSIDGSPVPDNMWYVDNYLGSRAFWVGRGDSSTFNTSFRDLILPNGDFSWRHVQKTEFGENIITKFTAKNVVLISDDYFWCRDIQMQLYNGHDRSLNTEYFAWSGQGTLLDKDNEWYISKAISYYNSIYDSIVTARQNISRYRSISFSSLMTLLEKYRIKTTFVSDTGTETLTEMSVRPIQPVYTMLLNTRTEQDGVIVPTEKMIAYPIYRYDGYYGPVFKDVHIPLSFDGAKSVYFGSIISGTRYLKKVAKEAMNILIDGYVDTYVKNIFSSEIYRYYTNENTYLPVNTLINREEWRSLVSSVLQYKKTFDVTVSGTTNRIVSLVEPLMNVMLTDIYNGNELQNVEKIVALSLYYDITDINKDQFDAKTVMFRNFFDSLFSKIYRVTQVKTGTTVIPFTYLDKFSISFFQDYPDLTITFSR